MSHESKHFFQSSPGFAYLGKQLYMLFSTAFLPNFNISRNKLKGQAYNQLISGV